MNKKEYTVGYFTETTDVDDYVEYNGRRIHPSELIDILNEQEKQIEELEKQLLDFSKLANENDMTIDELYQYIKSYFAVENLWKLKVIK